MSASRRQYERPGGRAEGPSKRRLAPRALRGKPFRRLQREFCQRYYRYPHRNLLITALPKSGSTWVENMLLEVPGFFRWFPREFNRQTMKDAAFHELSEASLLRPPVGYTVTKVHAGPSEHNRHVLAAAGRPFVILIRDPRDIAASWAHFVRIRPENAFAEETEGMEIGARIDHFTETLLDRFLSWAEGWAEHGEACGGSMIRYEDLQTDALDVMRGVFRHLDLDLPQSRIDAIVRKHAFQAATGRKPGQADDASFFRKGVSGDWVNHFTEENVRRFRAVSDGRLERFGYGW